MDDKGQLKAGDLVGSHRIIRKIGAGGMGEIYEALEPELNRRVAIKIIAERALENESVVERFKAEGRALAKLSHPNIVSVYVLGTLGNQPYIAMEYIEGLPLQDFLSLHSCGVRDLVHIFRQSVSGLMAAHQAGIVHRDLKPHNILVDEKFNVKLIDFGIAKVYSDQASLHTSASVFIGTVNYSAPEVLRGRPATSMSDIFSLGLVLYFMMTGDTPFTGSTQLEVMENVRSEELSFAKHLGLYFPEELKMIVAKMTAKKPEDRYQSCQEILEDLKTVPLDELPPELDITVQPNLELKNRDVIQELCRKEGFDDSEIRFIVSLASDIESKRSVNSGDISDKTVEIDMRRAITISNGSLVEAMHRFRLARSRLITKQISKDQLKRQTTTSTAKVETPKSKILILGLISFFLHSGAGLIFYFLMPRENPMPVFKVGQVGKIRMRRFHKPDPNYQNTTLDTFTIIKVSQGRVSIRRKNGDIIESGNNVFLPPFQETSTFDPANHWVETNTIYGETTSFFPLKVGKKSVNRIVGTRVSDDPNNKNVNRTYQYEYRCEVIGQEVVKIELGEVDTFKVKCSAQGSFNYERIYNYSPKIMRNVLQQQDGIDPYFEEMIYFSSP